VFDFNLLQIYSVGFKNMDEAKS